MKFRLPRGGSVLSAACFLFILLITFFAGVFGSAGAKVDAGLCYYFLVRDCESTTAGAVSGESYAAGGAGYLWEEEGAVVLACYFEEADATFVAHTMSERGVFVRVIERRTEPFPLRDGKERARIEANARTLDSCARLLYDTANGLERLDFGQEEARARLLGVAKTLTGLAEDNGEGAFGLWNAELLQEARRARALSEDLLFPKDVRYLEVALAFSVLNAGEYFA